MEDFDLDYGAHQSAASSRESKTFTSVRSLLSDVKAATGELHFDQSLRALQEAADLSQGFPALADAVFDTAVETAQELAAQDWRFAAAFLSEASQVRPTRVIPSSILAEMERMRAVPGVEAYPMSDRAERLQRLAGWRDDLSRCTCPKDADKIWALSAAELGADASDLEFASIAAEIEDEVARCRFAVDALDRHDLQGCLEQCKIVLRSKPDHQVFLGLKRKADAAEYSEQMSAVARIRALLDSGPLAEAQLSIKAAAERFPQSTELWELDLDIREKAIRVHNLLERGESDLHFRDFENAGRYFVEAVHLLPFDTSLINRVVGFLHHYAATIAEQDPQAMEAALSLVQRIQPGYARPDDIDVAIEGARARRAAELTTDPGMELMAVLEPEVLTPPPLEQPEQAAAEPAGTKEDVIDVGRRRHRFTPRPFGVMALAAVLVLLALAVRPLFVTQPKEVLEIPAVVPGTLTIRPNIDSVVVYINDHKYNVPVGSETAGIRLAPDVYQVRGVREGYADFGPMAAAVKAGSNTLIDIRMEPKPVSLEIRGALPSTRVTLDARLLGNVSKDGTLDAKIVPGEHFIGLSLGGYIEKTINRMIVAGEPAILSGLDVALESSDASSRSAKLKDVTRQSVSEKRPELKDLVSTLPQSLQDGVPVLDVQQAAWQRTDKRDPDALQAFLDKYPQSFFTAQAQDQIRYLRQLRTAQVENDQWNALDRSNKSAVIAFLAKYQSGPHVSMASALIAELDRRTAAAEVKRSEEAAWLEVRTDDRQSIDNYLARFPSSPHREEAQKAIADIGARDSSRAESAAILDVLRRLADAWSAKDLKSIASIQHDVDQRALRAQLGPVKALVMRISPMMPPTIEGTQATVVCKRQADETFSDGSARQNPEAIVTYVLSKHNGVWGIEHVR